MNSMILQVPMEKSFKLSAQKRAEEAGFSSLQDLVRFLLTQFTERKFSVTVSQNVHDEILTPKQEKVLTKKYNQAMKEIARGEFRSARTADEFMRQLYEDGNKTN